ncbi:unnamed protein product [Amoebophrya sp. A120]|nr:unnamed protein product [Amoebophrya sp. A120]|eukprot:GSA120T00007237001.1
MRMRHRFGAGVTAGLLAATLAPASASRSTAGENPIKKVLKLLDEMQTTLEAEAKEDDRLFKKMECWCRQNRGEKTEAVEKAQKKIEKLNGVIDEQTGLIASLSEEIKNLEAKIKADTEELAQMTELRAKEKAEAEKFQAETKDTLESLGKALKVLGGVQTRGALLDRSQKRQLSFLQEKLSSGHSFDQALKKDLWAVLGSLKNKNPGFLQQEPRDYSEMKPEAPTALEGGVAGANSYNSASGGIYGVLQQMHDDFSKQLKDSVDTEATAVANFKKASAAKEKEIAASKADKAATQKALGDAKVAKSNALKDKKLTTEQLSEDEQFLVMLEEKCKTAIDGHAERSKTRNDEIKAVGEAIGVLTSDESREIFAKNYSFLQTSVSSKQQNERKHAAIMELLQAAKKTGDKRLSALAISAQLDSFAKIKEMMAKLAEEVAAEKKAEFEKRDTCNKDLSDNEIARTDTGVFIEDTEKAIAKLQSDIETLEGQIAAEQASIKEMEGTVAAATETRKEENAAFKEEVKNQELTLKVLDKAKAKLTKFYGGLPGQAFLQQKQEPAPKQASYSKSEQAPGVIGLFEMIMSDCKHDIAEAKKDEQKAQTEYETLVADSTKSINTSKQAIAQKETEKSDAVSQKEQKNLELSQAQEKLEGLEAENAALHKDCDFLLKNFDVRQEAMESEVESIHQAIAVLSGANFDF